MCNIENILYLKFSIEKEIESITSNINRLNSINYQSQPLDNFETKIYTQLNTNIRMFGKEYLREQKTLLAEINKILEKNCQHDWINDVVDEPLSSREICYCSKCFLYRKSIKTE